MGYVDEIGYADVAEYFEDEVFVESVAGLLWGYRRFFWLGWDWLSHPKMES